MKDNIKKYEVKDSVFLWIYDITTDELVCHPNAEIFSYFRDTITKSLESPFIAYYGENTRVIISEHENTPHRSFNRNLYSLWSLSYNEQEAKNLIYGAILLDCKNDVEQSMSIIAKEITSIERSISVLNNHLYL